MNRRDFLKASVAGVGMTAFGSGIAGAGLKVGNKSAGFNFGKRRPNIIYILADDLGYSELGSYGQTKIKTPNIDKLAAEGMKFTDHYCGNAVCAPSRCCLMTGLHPGHAHVRNNKDYTVSGCERGQLPIPDSAVTIQELAKQAGYKTGAMGKWGLGGECSTGHPNNQGVDHWFGFLDQWEAHFYYPDHLWRNNEKVLYPENNIRTGQTYSHDEIAKEALEFINDNKDKPFFLYLPFTIPHVSLQVPQDSLDEYLELGWPETPYAGGHYTGHDTPRACYAAMITRMDKNVGRVMALIKQLDLDDDTIVMFTSDNGTTYCCGVDYNFFESVKPLRGLKGSLYEGGVRVPLIARWPGKIKPGTTSNHLSAFWDMMPTLCDLVGVKAPENTDGISFLPELLGKSNQQHEYLFWEIGSKMAARKGKWKAVWTDVKTQPTPTIALYDLDADISESTNVASSNSSVVSEMEQIRTEAHVYSPEFPILYSEVNG
jgi:arylsulfatase